MGDAKSKDKNFENEKKMKKNGDKTHVDFTEKVKEFKKFDEDMESEISIMEGEDGELAEEDQEKSEIDNLKDELKESKTMCADYLDKLRRNMAEFDNFRKRTAKEKAGMYDDGIKAAVDGLIPVLDNFELALNAATNKDDNFYKGVEMLCKQFQDYLTDLGVEEISALGAKFDPNLHDAVAHISDDAFGENEVIEEIRKGYKYKDKIIRHSMVRVAN